MAFRPDRMKELREQSGLSQSELANLIDVKQQHISRYELGKRHPAPDVLTKIADVLKTTSDYLLDLTDDPAQLSEDERKLLRTWRRMDAKGKNAFLLELFRKYESGQS